MLTISENYWATGTRKMTVTGKYGEVGNDEKCRF